MTEKSDKTTNFFQLPLFSKSRVQLLNLLMSNLDHSSSTTYIFTPNPEQAVLASRNTEFFNYLKQADILLPDGAGLIWAAKMLGAQTAFPHLKQRIAGREVVQDLLTLAQQRDLSVLILGGRDLAGKSAGHISIQGASPATADSNTGSMNQALKAKQVGLWWYEGYRQVVQPTGKEEQQVIELISRLKPDIIFVAFGAPHQERWLIEHKDLLNKNQVSIGMVVGGSFDTLTGRLAAPPAWISNLGVEWLFRLGQQPWRWRRQLSLVSFIWMVLKRAILRLE